MDMRALVLQMVSLQRASFDNGYEALATLQDQAERLTYDFMDQAAWIPSTSRGFVRDWFSMARKTRNDFKKAVDDGYDQLGGYIHSTFQNTFRL
ncbi:MAG TPA: hypothetical protein PKM41_10925 [Deltaproteobacteria bacterium]|jgi:hypothetical protein|nr:hypothetical protein [Deltaproteobacteria bacterium]HOI06447.1 hypothetical protein [Deltaproteobacteria bacterium]